MEDIFVGSGLTPIDKLLSMMDKMNQFYDGTYSMHNKKEAK